MIVSIIICTFNRSRLLDQTLAQFRSLDVDGCADWEILVVNNNSTDETNAVIRRHSGNLPLRRLWEPRPGKSYAANLAVREAKGDLLLWTDDDVLVDPGWLNAYVQAAREHSLASFFGGPITPWFESEPPEWIANNLPLVGCCYAVRAGFTEALTPINEAYLPYGANMATRRHCFDGCAFDTRIGPKGDTEIRGEETALLQKLLLRGLQGLWVQGAKVQHFIPRERLTEQFIWNFHCGMGRAEARLGQLATFKEILGMPRWAIRQYLGNLVLSKLLSHSKGERWVRSLKRAAYCRGVLKESRAQCVSSPDQT